MSIGIIGGQAVGKSHILNIIKDLGGNTMSCDDIYSDLIESHLKQWSRDYLKLDHMPSTVEINEHLFNSRDFSHHYRKIMHKLMGETIRESSPSYVEVPFWFNLPPWVFDEFWCVCCFKPEHRKRLLSRGMTDELAEKELIKSSLYLNKFKNITKFILSDVPDEFIIKQLGEICGIDRRKILNPH